MIVTILRLYSSIMNTTVIVRIYFHNITTLFSQIYDFLKTWHYTHNFTLFLTYYNFILIMLCFYSRNCTTLFRNTMIYSCNFVFILYLFLACSQINLEMRKFKTCD